MITTNNNQKDNHNFRIISESSLLTNFITCFKQDKRKNIATKSFDSYNTNIEYSIEIKNFKYIKESQSCCGTGFNYILFNNGDLYLLDIICFATTKKLKFLCNIANIINISEIIQIEPYFKNELMEFKSDIVVGIFILDINHRLFQLENENTKLISSNVNVFDIYECECDMEDKIKFILVFIKNNKTAVYYYYNITNEICKNMYSHCIDEYTITFEDTVNDINIHQCDVLFKYSHGLIKTFDLNNIKTNMMFTILLNPICQFNENKYYNDRLTIDILLNTKWGKPIIFQLVICFFKRRKKWIPMLIIKKILRYLSINSFEKVVSFLDDD